MVLENLSNWITNKNLSSDFERSLDFAFLFFRKARFGLRKKSKAPQIIVSYGAWEETLRKRSKKELIVEKLK